MKTIIVAYQEKPEAVSFTQDLVLKIKNQVHLQWVGPMRAEEELISHLENAEMVLTMGGDGTILGVGRICAPYKVPVVGVNFGRVGFLTELEPDEVESLLPAYLDGDCWIDQRLMLHATLETNRGPEEFIALNDVVVARGALPRLVRIKTWVDKTQIYPTAGDGMIISTPTGSTAYSLAAGGPVLHPAVEAFMLTPIVPHLAAQRSIVLPADATVKLQVFTNYPAVFSADGQIEREMADGDTLTVKKGPHVALFLRRQRPTHFYDLLIAKLRGH